MTTAEKLLVEQRTLGDLSFRTVLFYFMFLFFYDFLSYVRLLDDNSPTARYLFLCLLTDFGVKV